MAWSIPTLIGTASLGINGGTSGTFNTSGYDFLAVAIPHYTATGSITVFNDSISSTSNTWVASSVYTSSSFGSIKIYHTFNVSGLGATVGAGHTFTATGSGVYPGLIIIGGVGSKIVSDPGETATGNNSSGTTVSPNSVTPLEAYELLLCALSSGASVNADMLITGDNYLKLGSIDYSAGNNLGGSIGYVIQGASATAANPQWSSSTSTLGLSTVQRSFKVGSAPAAGSVPMNKIRLQAIGRSYFY